MVKLDRQGRENERGSKMSGAFRDRKIADEHIGGQMQCRSCMGQYEPKIVLEHGGLCLACFDHYCQAANPIAQQALDRRALLAKMQAAINTFAAGKPNPRAMMETLRARRERIGRLGPAQRAQLDALEAMLDPQPEWQE